MKTLKIYTLAILIAFVLLMPNFASAAVCFAGDESCGGAGSFDGTYVDPVEDAKKQCLEAGYIQTTCPQKQHVGGVCPYYSQYVMCCGDSYAYSACLYPLSSESRCGNSWRCKCVDSFKYGTRQACINNSTPGGASCMQIDDDEKNMSIHYDRCVCDRGVFPYEKNGDCGLNQVLDTYSPCIDTFGGTFYRKCTCPSGWSSCVTMGPAIGAKKCVIDGESKYSECCICSPTNGYELNLQDPNAKKYDPCSCNSSYRKIASCNIGYVLKNGRCVEPTCEDAVAAWIDASSSRKNDYILITSSNASVNPSQKYIIYSGSVTPTWMRRGKTYYGAAYFGKIMNDSMVKMKCKGLSKVKWDYASFDSGTFGTNINGLELDLTVNFSESSRMGLKNSSLNAISGASIGALDMSTDTYYDISNETAPTLKGNKLSIVNLYLAGVSVDVNEISSPNARVFARSSDTSPFITNITFKAKRFNVTGDSGKLRASGGDYYVQHMEVCSGGNDDDCGVYVTNGAKWYLYSDASNDHVIQVNRCSGFATDYSSRIIRHAQQVAADGTHCPYGVYQSRCYSDDCNRSASNSGGFKSWKHVGWNGCKSLASCRGA